MSSLRIKTFFRMRMAAGADAVMCTLINSIQSRLQNQVCTPEELDLYLSACESISRDLFYQFQRPEFVRAGNYLEWLSPVKTAFPENQKARARVFLCDQGFRAPTVIFLHALMSAHDVGYSRIAAHLNRRGWNALLMHLPYHYSRVPRGHFNGALALTSNLPHNAETVRQAVTEVRQLMEYLRANGCPEFGMIGTSYGGWVGALVSFMEREFRFVTLLQPIADIEHAIWESPASSMIRKTLMAVGIEPGFSRRHAHLTSPLHGRPACEGKRVLIIGGKYDTIAPACVLERLAQLWPQSRLVLVEQGHFGYAAMREALRGIDDLL
ncbi:MAG: alpha/beta hydrolase family protein [Verrucomicrobia bacterium]|nr:alpha/beta hydrolase family protein [Verrucomicrobiota bacterium]